MGGGDRFIYKAHCIIYRVLVDKDGFYFVESDQDQVSEGLIFLFFLRVLLSFPFSIFFLFGVVGVDFSFSIFGKYAHYEGLK